MGRLRLPGMSEPTAPLCCRHLEETPEPFKERLFRARSCQETLRIWEEIVDDAIFSSTIDVRGIDREVKET